MRDDRHQPSKDSLDQAIRNALQMETDQERLERLEHYWIVQSKTQRRRQLVLRYVSAAAAVVAMAAAFTLIWYQPDDFQLTDNTRDSAPVREDSGPVEPLHADGVLPTEISSAGRLPTAYERLMFAARTKVRVPASTQVASIDHAINQLTLDPSKDAERALESLGLEPAEAETMLLRRLPNASSSQQAVILQILGLCGTQRAVPAVLRVGKQDTLRDAALTTIEQIVGIENLAEVVRSTSDRRLRAGLMLRLLSANLDAALHEYLSLVRAEAVRAEALAVAMDAERLPVAALLTLLDDEDKQLRLPAAMVLGHVNGPEVTRLLIARVTSKPSNSTEAWLALLACRGDLAEEFLSYATQQPQLLGYCNYARVQWAQMIP